MHVRPVWVAALAACGAAAAWSQELTELPPASGSGVARGVALLRCTDPQSALIRSSHATIVDAGPAARADVLLTTAHGLPSSREEIERDCRVLVRGRQYAIERVWNSGSHAAAPEHDWTVLLLGEFIKGDVLRWRASDVPQSWLDELVADNARVRFVLRYADAAQMDCRLESRTAHNLLAHSCVAYPGTSGSPLVVGADLAPVLIAIHLGSELRFDGVRFDMVSVARPLDAAVLAAIEAAGGEPKSAKRHRR
jgi:hypothetical protein